MTISLRYAPVTVDDVDAAIGFYRDALGLEVVNDVSSDGHRWVSFGFADQPGLTLVISDPAAGRSDEDGESLRRMLAKGTAPGPVVFAADDVDAAFARAEEAGAEVMQEPQDQSWGPRDCAFRDPSGNHIRISQA